MNIRLGISSDTLPGSMSMPDDDHPGVDNIRKEENGKDSFSFKKLDYQIEDSLVSMQARGSFYGMSSPVFVDGRLRAIRKR